MGYLEDNERQDLGPVERTTSNSKSSRLTTVVGLLAVVAALHIPIMGIRIVAPMILGSCLLIALIARLYWLIPTALLFSLMAGMQLVVPKQFIVSVPVVPTLIPVLLTLMLLWTWSNTRSTLNWLRFGRIDRFARWLVILTGIGSSAALIGWATWSDNLGIGEQMMASVMTYPIWFVAGVLIPLFAIANACVEECVFRGILQSGLSQLIKNTVAANVLQAAAFAAIHFEMGFPNGAVGYGMAWVYGIVLGYLRLRTRGLLAPILAHIIADVVIGLTLLSLVV